MLYYSSYISCVGLNLVIILTNLICFFTISDKDSSVLPFVVFTILAQLAIAVNFCLFLRPHFYHDYHVRSKIHRQALDVLNRRITIRQEHVSTNPKSESNVSIMRGRSQQGIRTPLLTVAPQNFHRTTTGSDLKLLLTWREERLLDEELDARTFEKVEQLITNETTPYLKMTRTRTSGPIRIGTSL